MFAGHLAAPVWEQAWITSLMLATVVAAGFVVVRNEFQKQYSLWMF